MSDTAEKSANSETEDLYAKPGITKGEQLATFALPRGWDWRFVILAQRQQDYPITKAIYELYQVAG